MEEYVQITRIKEYIYCPRSVYFQFVYEKYDEKLYHTYLQQRGKMKHSNIDNQVYSTRKNILQGLMVYSNKYQLLGKIDLYDKDSQILVERKYQIKRIFDGYKYQLYAQMFCLEEMGYPVRGIELYSMVDNKKYKLLLPNDAETAKFESIIEKIHNYKIEDYVNWQPESSEKCNMCIYRELCL